MKISATEAAKLTQKSIPTITRAIKSGKISAEKLPSGGYLIDTSELFRVFKAVTTKANVSAPVLGHETPQVTHSENQSLLERIRLLEETLSDVKADRDEWREQAKRLAITQSELTAKAPSSSLWQKLFRRS